MFVADEIVDRIWRVPILAGDPFGPRELYAIATTDGTIRAANLVARGVPLAVPAR